jgi:hypothetical protein
MKMDLESWAWRTAQCDRCDRCDRCAHVLSCSQFASCHLPIDSLKLLTLRTLWTNFNGLTNQCATSCAISWSRRFHVSQESVIFGPGIKETVVPSLLSRVPLVLPGTSWCAWISHRPVEGDKTCSRLTLRVPGVAGFQDPSCQGHGDRNNIKWLGLAGHMSKIHFDSPCFWQEIAGSSDLEFLGTFG